MTTVYVAAIPQEQEDDNFIFDKTVIAIEGDYIEYNTGIETLIVPSFSAKWSEIPVTGEMACTYGEYAGLYLPDGNITPDDTVWCQAWGIDLTSLSYSVGFGEEVNNLFASHLALKAKLSGKSGKQDEQKEEKEEKAQKEENEWASYMEVKSHLTKWDRYENSDDYVITHGEIISENLDSFKSQGYSSSSSDGIGSRTVGNGLITVRVVTYRLPNGEEKTLRNPNPSHGKTEREWVLSHNAGYWNRRKQAIESTASDLKESVEPLNEAKALIEKFEWQYPELIKKCQEVGIQVKLTSCEDRKIVVRSRDLTNGFESYPGSSVELHQSVLDAIQFKINKNLKEDNAKNKEKQLVAQQQQSQLPYKVACEKAGYKVEWNLDSYLAKVGKKWTDCRTVCRQKNLPVEFSKKLILKK